MNYDPFVKEDFVLPEKWYVSVTNETFKDINIFKSKTSWKEKAIDYKAVGYEGVGYNSPPNDYTKITFEQFKKYVLKEPIEHGNGILDAVESKQPSKQAVHCKTQEEWNFVLSKLPNSCLLSMQCGKFTELSNRYKYKNGIAVDIKHCLCSSIDWYKNDGYKILSFQEWCDLNGYKMENEVKFEVGKWYKMNDCWYLRYKGKDIIATDKIYMSECIDSTFNHKYDNGFVAYLHEQKTWRLASIEEIQQYLPDNHPDKIKSNQEFKVGEYIFVMAKGGCYGDILKVTSVEPDEKDSGIKGTVWIKHENRSFSGGGFRLGSKYRYNEHVRHATSEEINQHLISIGQIPAGEPLNTGIEPNKDGMFKYKQTMPGSSWSGGTIDNHLDIMIQSKTQSEIEFNYLPEPK